MNDESLIWESYKKTILNESTSPLRRLYHSTQLYIAAKIVTEDKFELTFSMGADAEQNKNKIRNFYLSTSRIPTNRYARGSERKYYDKTSHCLIELDASKLSDNYKIVPIDYWMHVKTGTRYGPQESEDRILSRKPSIPNAKKYITAIHIYVPPDDKLKSKRDLEGKTQEEHYINLIAHSGVDYYLYDNVFEFASLRKEKAHKLKGDYQYELKERPTKYTSEDFIIDEINFFVDPDNLENEKTRDKMNRYWNWRELYSTLTTDLHNAKSKKTPEIQNAIFKLSEYMRKTNKSLEEIAKDAFERERNLQ
jgi:hypothetical protein